MATRVRETQGKTPPSTATQEQFCSAFGQQCQNMRKCIDDAGRGEAEKLDALAVFIKTHEVAVLPDGIHWRVGREEFCVPDALLAIEISKGVVELEKRGVSADFSGRYEGHRKSRR